MQRKESSMLHSVEHLFHCSAHRMQLTVEELWDDLVALADFLNLDVVW